MLLALTGSFMLWSTASAQQGTVPPSAFAGTISLNGQPVPTEQLQTLRLEAFVNGTECTGQPGQKFFFEEGGVTLYRMDVLAQEDRAGCGKPGDNVEFFINGEKAPQEATWELGRLIIVNLNLGEGQPTDIPTPTATIPGSTPDPDQPAPTRYVPTVESERDVVGSTDGQGGDGDDPGSRGNDGGGPSDEGASTVGAESNDEGNGTRVQSAATSGDDGGGFPVWAGILIAVVGVGVVGGGAGTLLYKRMNGTTPPPAQPGA
jgi:hypothetical protein